MQLGWIDAGFLQEWISLDHLPHFVCCYDENGYAESKIAENSLADTLRKIRGRSPHIKENDVAILNVSFDASESERRARFAKLFHPDRFLSRDIDPSQHRDVSRHDSHPRLKTLYTCSCPQVLAQLDRDASKRGQGCDQVRDDLKKLERNRNCVPNITRIGITPRCLADSRVQSPRLRPYQSARSFRAPPAYRWRSPRLRGRSTSACSP